MKRNHSPHRTAERGSTLLEALIAFLVLALGMLTVARLHSHLQLGAETARQRAEAVRLAQEDIESLRAFAVLAAAPGATSFDAIASATRSVDTTSNTRYSVERRVDGGPAAKGVQVAVRWADRAGAAQQVVLNTLVAGTDPALSGALSLERGGDPVRGPFGRSVQVPFAAQDLGDGRSAFKPVEGGSVAYLFDHRSGAPTARCSTVPTTLPTRSLTLATLGPCSAWSGLWLSGEVRFSSALPPDAAAANDAPLPLAVELVPGGSAGPAAACHVDAMKTVAFTGAAGQRLHAVPLAAAPAWLGLTAWVETGERFAAYHCAIETAAAWSGRVTVVPSGWRFGSAAGERRLCRHSSDLDGSGAIDTAWEHPATRSGVGAALRHQNFLVVDGSAACPAGRAVRVAGNNTDDVHVDLSTAPHAP